MRGMVNHGMAGEFRLQKDVSLVDTDDGAVLLDERSGRYWQLNATGHLTLRALLDGRTPEESAQQLADTYQVSLEQAAADVTSLMRQLSEARLAGRS
jgi:hypothetical protein